MMSRCPTRSLSPTGVKTNGTRQPRQVACAEERPADAHSSRRQRASVIIATPDGQHALLVVRDAGQMVLDVSADRTKNNGEEAKMLDFFEARYG